MIKNNKVFLLHIRDSISDTEAVWIVIKKDMLELKEKILKILITLQ